MKYIGEHLLPGQIGHFFIVLSLVASLVATFAFYFASKQNILEVKKSWLKFARIAFLLESISVLAVFVLLYYIISHHLFEYKYAWQHSDKQLQLEYLLSCFWEGQEGSFLLWSFWHCVLGWILIWKAKDWEAGVMTVVSFAQFCLATMTLGIYFFGHKVGSNPFALLRNEMDAPIFANANYLEFVKDGNGLNALLQNYWMVIHPPILFLGFASVLIPFAFAFAGLMSKKHDWIKPALPWASFSAAALGLGIMLGAMWAYESLNFGGYWAWDPVENASLVPWLTLVAGLHTNLIYKHSGYSLRATYFFYIISFVFILYSTFLTRSGILGDASVHAFTDLGMNWQLLLFILVFLLPAAWLFLKQYKTIPSIKKEEHTWSREFWMFVGSLVLCLSGFVIISITSLPAFNRTVEHFRFLQKIFKNAFAQPDDAEFTHNQIQVFVAIIIGLLTGAVQFLKYKNTPKSFIGKKFWLPVFISLIVALLIIFVGKVHYSAKGIGFMIAIHLAVFSSVYAIVGNISYISFVLKGKLKSAGGSVAHLGFGLIILGILISSGKKKIISWNKTGIAVFKKTAQEDPAENTTLFKGIKTDMHKYMVTYTGDKFDSSDRKRYYEIDFSPKNGSKGFKVYPNIIKNNKGDGFSPNPDAKHFLTKDIFVYITSFKDDERENDTTTFRNTEINAGDTAYFNNGFIVMKKANINPDSKKHLLQANETGIFLDMEVISKEGGKYIAAPGLAIKSTNEVRLIYDTVLAQNLILSFNKVIDAKTGKIEIGVKENDSLTSLLTLKVLEFPMIKLLWLGVIIMVVGLIMSIIHRVKSKPSKV
ncbi:MAG TPA: cytochrome c biogenesis protein CcsA [Chitinophagaceae bacterium]|nr:cytochrome c biogenesis protein CcsA [Chitinophagaceae bacterium]MCC6634968.1 cytochrome c biogenesis protein CcsA [Chitinophagaceae bacterium]HNF28805.1 cytochrome c biogenesis protein CcsA [Chitinophagaceae bacterium]HNJ57704.1 cytochrome c biogenesis protein CcsA [Chitinophagaceae bacterium]